MASISSEFHIAEEIDNEDSHKDASERESSSVYSKNADMMLMLLEEGKEHYF